MPLSQHRLKYRGLLFPPQTHARFLVIAALFYFVDYALAQHLLFQTTQRFFNRLVFFKSDFDHLVLTSYWLVPLEFSIPSARLTPTASATPPATASPAITASASAKGAGSAFLAWTRLVDRQGAPLQVLAVEGLNGRLRAFGRTHGHKRETTRLARLAVLHELDLGDGTMRGEQILKIVLGDVIG